MNLMLTTRLIYKTGEWEVCRITRNHEGELCIDQVGGPYATEAEAKKFAEQFSDILMQEAMNRGEI